MKHSRTLSLVTAVTGVLVFVAVSGVSTRQAPVQRDFSRELANKMRGTYTVAAVGDLLAREPAGKQASAELQKMLQGANTTIGQLEFYEADRGPAVAGLSPKEFVQDLTTLGFDLLGLGTTQGGDNTLRNISELLTAVGLPLARPDWQPVYQSLVSGRAALIAGPHPIRLSTAKYVTAEQLAQLKAIQAAIVARRNEPDVSRPVGVPNDPPNQVTIFSDTYVLGPVAGEIREEPNAQDRQASLMAVRAAKEYADFVAFSMSLPPAAKGGHYSMERQPHSFTVALAHDLVDNGMDMYVGHGNHVVQGIEIYKGRPIFYNLGDLSAHRSGGSGDALTALIATARYQDGILQEVRIQPVDLGSDPQRRPASTVGVPMTPSPEVANRVLSELQRNSEPFGTKIALENGVGVIRVPREATTAIGEGIRDFGTAPRGGGGGRGGRGRGGFEAPQQ